MFNSLDEEEDPLTALLRQSQQSDSAPGMSLPTDSMPDLAQAAPKPMPMSPGAELAPQSQGPSPLNPVVSDYLKQKMQSQADDPYSNKARQALVDSQSGYDTRGAITGALAALGAGFQGGNSVAAAQNALSISQKNRDNQINQFDRSKAAQLETDKNDPNSRASQLLQGTVRKLYGKNISEEQIAKITAADADMILKPLELKAKLDEVANKREDMRLTRKDAMSKKTEDEYQKYVQGQEHLASSLRGDDAAKLSSAKLSAIASGRALLKQFEGREDEMTPDQLALLAADRVKAVTGGVPTNEEIKHMMPSNTGTTGASLKSYFSGKPEAAHSGGWVKEANVDFAAQEKAARAILENRQKQLLSNPKLRPEDRERIVKMAIPPEGYGSGAEISIGDKGAVPQTKVVAGKTYKKVPGGWEEVSSQPVADRGN